jgi:flagellar motor switch protein FliN/FliY
MTTDAPSEGSTPRESDALGEVEVRPHRLDEIAPEARPATGAGAPERPSMDLILDVPVDVTVEIGETSVSLEEVMKFVPGHVVKLSQTVEQPVIVRVNGRPIAEGEIVDLGDTLGVRITSILDGAADGPPARPAGSGPAA